MKIRYIAGLLAVITLSACFTNNSQQSSASRVPPVQPPEQVVASLNKLYNDSATECRELFTNKPRGLYYCSGITIRVASDSPDYEPWTHSPRAIELGASSYSWLRHDVKMLGLLDGDDAAGFILRNPVEGAAANLPILEKGFICQYPFDAFSKNRLHKGCGLGGPAVLYPQPPADHRNSAYAWGQCEGMGIGSMERWIAYYFNESVPTVALRPQCSWNADNIAGWNYSIATHARFIEDYIQELKGPYTWNELMLDVMGDNGSMLKPFISAFFYDVRGPTSLGSARNFQRKLNARGYNVPIVRLDFAAPASQRFSYWPEDQFIPQ
ncbi:MAG TPA: hypothetical protein VF682_17915 [Pseudomonas sp.]|jgi:hypothetical protein